MGDTSAAPVQQAGFNTRRLGEALAEFASGPVNFHGLVILRHGVLVAESYRTGRDRGLYQLLLRKRRFDASQLHDMRSVTRSVIGLLWGIAATQGKVPGMDTPVMALYPELKRLALRGKETVTVRHLLTNTCGLSWREINAGTLFNHELRLYWRTYAPYLFRRPLATPPGMRFNYNGCCTSLLAELLAKHTGMTLTEFARIHLFEPLGITQWEWRKDLRGRPLAFSGLRLRPADLARIGQFVLQRGQWQGRQLLPAAWVDEAIRPHVDTGDGRQYGYHWWLGKVDAIGRPHQWVGAIGNGGQRLYIVPALDLAVAITAGAYNSHAISQHCTALLKKIAAAVEH
ncbi:serine hydrolase domain-containing protein [Pseudoduganella rivuli]|uniref:serine hydrolase domain-containing protein n=1 Tax=Pseudoduganella rivuli TaxID=2666085 RepID=UPI0012B0A5C3|nr:serine hydrolase [Pseudoduganella rivuli]